MARVLAPSHLELELCLALGLDPSRVISFEAQLGTSKIVHATILDDPKTGARHTEAHRLPDGWEYRHQTTEPTTVGELRESQTGRTITVHDGDTTITGPFTGLHIDQEWIEEYELTDPEPRRTPGRKTVTLTVGRWQRVQIDPATRVTLHGEAT